MRKRLLERDPLTRTEKWFHWDATGDNYAVETKQDVSSIIEANKAEYAATDEHAPWGEMRRIGSIPMPLYYELQQKGVIDPFGEVKDEKPILKFLADRDNLDFRVRPGRLI